MPHPLLIDPALLDPSAISAETRTVNDEIVRRLDAEPVGLTIPEIRARRIAGIGAFPAAPKSPRAETTTIAGPLPVTASWYARLSDPGRSCGRTGSSTQTG